MRDDVALEMPPTTRLRDCLKPFGVISSRCSVPFVDHGKAVANFHGLYRVDAHRGVSQLGVEGGQKSARPGLETSLLPPPKILAPMELPSARKGHHVIFHGLHFAGIGAEEWVLLDLRPIKLRHVDFNQAKLA